MSCLASDANGAKRPHCVEIALNLASALSESNQGYHKNGLFLQSAMMRRIAFAGLFCH